MNRRRLAAGVIGAGGLLLLAVGVIHLAVTPLLKRAVLDPWLTPDQMTVVAPPFLLNHVVVGILLLPLGFVTSFSASGIRAGERWAWVIAWAVSGTMPLLPLVLVLFMSGGHFHALPFRVAECLVATCAAVMPAALIFGRRGVRETPSDSPDPADQAGDSHN
jgi:hypothetical protein